MDFWIFRYIIDWTLFVFVAGTVLYMGVYAVAALFDKRAVINKAKSPKPHCRFDSFLSTR